MSQKIVWIVVLLLVSSFVVGAQDAEIDAWVCPEGFEGQTLSIFNWSTYIAEDTVPNFEEACGVKIEYAIFENSDQALAVLRAGNPGYDLVVPSDYTVAIMAGEGLLMELDKDLIPNIANVAPEFLDPNFDPGNTYSLPYQWGTIGIGYNTEAFPDGIDSWEDLWTADAKVAWLEEPRSMLGVGLLMLGYDPNSDNPDEYEEAAEYLMERGDNVVAVAADDGQAMLERGDVDATIEYNGDIYQIIYDCECETYAYSIPSEGAVLWSDNMVIPSDAPNPELAMVFMDYILHPQVSADLSNYIAYGSPNAVAVDLGLIDEALLTDPGIYPSDEVIENLFVIIDLPELEATVNDLWDEIKLEIG